MPYFCIKYNPETFDNVAIYVLGDDKRTSRDVKVFNVDKNLYEVRHYEYNISSAIIEEKNIEDALIKISLGWLDDNFYYKKYNGMYCTKNGFYWIVDGIPHTIIDTEYKFDSVYFGGTPTEKMIGCEITIRNPDGWTFTFNKYPPKRITVHHNGNIDTFDVTTNEMFTTWLSTNYNY